MRMLKIVKVLNIITSQATLCFISLIYLYYIMDSFSTKEFNMKNLTNFNKTSYIRECMHFMVEKNTSSNFL